MILSDMNPEDKARVPDGGLYWTVAMGMAQMPGHCIFEVFQKDHPTNLICKVESKIARKMVGGVNLAIIEQMILEKKDVREMLDLNKERIFWIEYANAIV